MEKPTNYAYLSGALKAHIQGLGYELARLGLAKYEDLEAIETVAKTKIEEAEAAASEYASTH